MDHYIDITILPDPEFIDSILMNALFEKLHFAFVKISNSTIGISFPNANKTLGNCLRLHGTEKELIEFMKKNWVGNLSEFLEISKLLQVPKDVKFRIVKRTQAKSNVARLLRRSVSKGWITEEEATAKFSLLKEKKLQLPFVKIKSSSSNQNFRLYIEQTPLLVKPRFGAFNTYGLSNEATVPWF